jgi:DNA mismatch repair protein MutL
LAGEPDDPTRPELPGTQGSESARPEVASAGEERLPMLRVLGQVARTYIIAEGPEGIFLIDQHAAHERVLYEKLRRTRLPADGALAQHAQALLEPLTVELSPQQAARLEEQAELLQSVGFQIEPFGGSAYLLRAVPVIMSEGDPRQSLVTILDEMADEREWQRPGSAQPLNAQREAMLIASVCKQGAIKAGRLMSLPEMQELIHQLEQSESPRTCPHGRPTVIRLALDQLARQFGRG